MADTCSGIYFWSWSTSPSAPLGPRLARSGCPRTSPGTRSFSPIEFNGYPRRLIYWMRSFAPPARNDFATVAHRCRPPPLDGGKRKKGALCLYVRKFLFLREWKFASSICRKFFFLLMGWEDLERFRVKAYRRFFCSKFNLWLELFKDWKKESNI